MKSTQYFNLLSWCWQQMSADRSEKVMVVCDEAWLLINPDVPQAMSYLRDTEKRARKYSGALAVATQNVVDFLDPKVKLYWIYRLQSLFSAVRAMTLKQYRHYTILPMHKESLLPQAIVQSAL